MPDRMKEICGNCGIRYGLHLNCGTLQPYPENYCPGPGCDFSKGPGTCFKPTNTYKED